MLPRLGASQIEDELLIFQSVMEPFLLSHQTPDSEIVPLAPSFDTLPPTWEMTESNSMASATQMDVPELELLSPQVESPLGEGVDPLTGISLPSVENLTITEDIRLDNTDDPLLKTDTRQVTAGTDEPLDVVLLGGRKKPQRESILPVIVANLRGWSDTVTNNPLIEGTVTDNSPIQKFTAGFDGLPGRKYRNLLGLLAQDGKFSLDAALLQQINRNRPLTEGQHTLHLRARDRWNNLSSFDLTFTIERTKPRLTASLVEDTGSSNSDRITNNAALSGRIEDSSGIASFKAQFEAAPLSNFVDVTPYLQADRTFILDNAVLKQINGNTELSQGQHTLKLLATDKAGNTSDLISYTFTLDTIAPTQPNFALDPTFDTAPIGDGSTTFTTVALSGGTEGHLQVTLVGTGQKAIVSPTGQFSFTEVPLVLGDNPFTVQAEDLAGNISQFSTSIERVTDTDSEIELLTVMPGQTLEISLASILPNSTDATFSLASEGQLPTGQLLGDGTLTFNPTTEEIGTYPFTVIATLDGQGSEHKFTLEVIADPVTTTRISGVIENTDGQPLAGVIIELGNLQTTTDANGAFTLETLSQWPSDTLKVRGEVITGQVTYPSIAEKLSLLLGRDPIERVNNVISRPIYLPPIDTAHAVTIDPTVDTIVTNETIPGASVFVSAGSLLDGQGELYTGTMSITEVPMDLTPVALPPELLPDFVVFIHPAAVGFSLPASLFLPNLAGYAPGTALDLWSVNPNTGLFGTVGTGAVSADGSTLETLSGGIGNSGGSSGGNGGWYFFTPSADPPDNPDDNNYNRDQGCDECQAHVPATSDVELHSGAVIETHDLVSYQSNGVNRGLTLTYDSLRADPRPIVHFGYANPVFYGDRLVASLTVSQGSFTYQVPGVEAGELGLDGGEHIWNLPSGGSSIDAALQADLRSLPSGRYDYQLTSGVLLEFGDNLFGAFTRLSKRELLHVNSIGSPFGSGWGVAGWQELVENWDGSVLLIDGDGGEMLFEAPQSVGDPYICPPGDESSLEKLADGTFRRTQLDRTVYTFNASYQLEKVADRNGNETRYVYDTVGHLSEIIDPVGLETHFTYEGERVSAITDPTGRVTQLKYDGAGNLKQVIDPDGSSRTWGYDTEHHMTTEIDKQGHTEQMFYDFAGRADRAIRKDGSELDFDPVQVQGLYPPSQTTDPSQAPIAYGLNETPTSTYLDANGHSTTTVLDQAGQTVSATDEIGLLSSVKRNKDNVVTNRTDGRGYQTEYIYDERGNLIKIVERIKISNPQTDPSPFQATVNYSLDGSWEAMAVGDLNGDNCSDLVLGHSLGISLLLGNGDGTLALPTLLTSLSSNALALSDLNHDGHLDLVTATSGDLSVWFGQGDGILGEPIKTEIDYSFTDLVLGDFNSDGTLDAVVAGREVALFLGNGNGTFTAGAVTDDLDGGGIQIDHLDLESADLDGDGHLDLAVSFTGSGYGSDEAHLVLFFGQGDGSLGEQVAYQVDGKYSALGVGDLDGDEDLDLVTANPEDDLISVWLNGGDRSWSLSTSGAVGRYPDDLALGDVNADGQLDVVVANQGSDSVSVLLGNGDGTFVPQTELSVGRAPGRVGLADVDADGDLDLLATLSRSEDNVALSLNGEQLAPVEHHYSYDPVFNQLTGEIDELGRQTIYDINPDNGNLRSVTRVVGELGGSDDVITSYTYTPRGLVDLETDPKGRVTDYDYDTLGRLEKVTYALGTSDEASVRYEYDGAGNQTAVIDENGHRTEYEYDDLNRGVKTIYAVGTTEEAIEEIEYDDAGHQTATIDGNRNRTEYAYEDSNRRVKTIFPDPDGSGPLTSPTTTQIYDALGNLRLVIDPLLHQTEYVYDERNRLVETIDPERNRTQYRYDADNHLRTVIDPLNHRTASVYDSRGRLIRQSDAGGHSTRNEYDAANQLIAQIDARGNRTKYEYDDLGRQIAVIDAQGNITRTEYDKVGNVVAEIDELGHRTEYTYDNRHRRTHVYDALSPSGVTLTGYDQVGNVTSITDPVNNLTTFIYDERNRLTFETNQLGEVRSFTYDDASNRLSATDCDGRVRTFIYDALSRQTAENWLDEAGVLIRTISSTYDAASQLTAVTDPDATYDFSYDALGRLRTVDNTGTPGVPEVVLTYTYDDNGNLLSVGETIDGQTGGTTAYTYDELDRVKLLTQTGNGVTPKRVDFTYDAIGQYESIDRYADLKGTGLVIGSNYIYDSLNRLENLTHSNTTSTVAFYDYIYDEASRITQITDVDGKTDYTYDPTNQLTVADHSDLNNPDEAYSYDANGNRNESGYVTGENNRLESDGQYNYEYDREGNLIRQTEMATGKVRSFQWDWRNRLVAVVDKDEAGNVLQEVKFTYDAMNHRIAKKVDTNLNDAVDRVVTYFVYDGDNVLLEFVDEDGIVGTNEPVLSTRYLHGTRADEVLAQEDAAGEVLWHLADHLGTIRDLVDNSGDVVNHFTYDSYGNVISETNPAIDTRYLYTGREFDSETGLYYYRARYYDAQVGRFISEDPIGFEAEDSNWYRYVGNSPVDTVDPSGLNGFVITQRRRIVYREDGVQKVTDDMKYVDKARKKGATIDITHDETVADIIYSPKKRTTNPPDPYGGKLKGNESGHIIPNILGGKNRKNNVFSEDRGTNRGLHRIFDNEVNRNLDNQVALLRSCPPQILELEYTVFLKYDQNIIHANHPNYPLRPTSFIILANFSNPQYSRQGIFNNPGKET